MIDPKLKRMFQIKIALVVLMTLQGVVMAILSRGEHCSIPDQLAYRDGIGMPLSFVLLALGCLVFGGGYLFGISFLKTAYGKVTDVVLRYFDFTWLMLGVVAGHMGMGIVALIRHAITLSPGFWGNLLFYFIILAYTLLLNRYACRYCDDWQKRYYLGPLLNSGIDSLIRKMSGKSTFP